MIADKEIEVNPSDKEEKQDAYVDYSTFTSYPFYVMGYEPVFENGCLVSRYPGEWYQYFVADQIPTTIGQTYKLTAYIKGSAPGTLNAQFGNWGALVDRPLSFNEDWQEVSVEFDNCQVESSFIVFQPGTFEGDTMQLTLTAGDWISKPDKLLSIEKQDVTVRYYVDDSKLKGTGQSGYPFEVSKE